MWVVVVVNRESAFMIREVGYLVLDCPGSFSEYSTPLNQRSSSLKNSMGSVEILNCMFFIRMFAIYFGALAVNLASKVSTKFLL